MSEEKLDRTGFLVTFLAFFIWGLLPVYWKAVDQVPALEIIAHRIFWSLVLLAIIIPFRKKGARKEILKSKRVLLSVALGGIFLGLNWFLYVWAVNSGHIVQSSLGYYISPLLTVLFGVFFFKEKLGPLQVAALLLAALGVVIVTVEYGTFPWISFFIALTFVLYGSAKKRSKLDSLSGLFMETLFLGPFAAAYIIGLGVMGGGAFIREGIFTSLILAGAGVVTSLPLFLFGMGTQRIPLVSVGFLQYIAPTFMLLIGVLLYGEAFTPTHAAAFGCIWAALGIYSYSLIRRGIKNRSQKTVLEKRT